jgi:hypothetical protein
MRLRLNNRLTSLIAAIALLGSGWALRGFCDEYVLASLKRPPEYPTPAETICWQVSGGALAVATYLALLFLLIAAAIGEKDTQPPVRTAIRVFVFLGTLVSFGMLTLTLVTLYFYGNLDPNFL